MITYECYCGYTREVPDDWVGKNVKCPKCGNTGDVQLPRHASDDGQWNLTDGPVAPRAHGQWRDAPPPRLIQQSEPMTYTQGAWIIALLALPFVLQLILFVLYMMGMLTFRIGG